MFSFITNHMNAIHGFEDFLFYVGRPTICFFRAFFLGDYVFCRWDSLRSSPPYDLPSLLENRFASTRFFFPVAGFYRSRDGEYHAGAAGRSGSPARTGESHRLSQPFFVRLDLRGGRCSHGCFSIKPRMCGRDARALRHPGLMVILP